jgi:hypothetical protein
MKFNGQATSFLHMRRTALWALLLPIALAPSQAGAQKTTLEIITLKYRTAEQLIPALQPLVAKSGTISGLQNQLIIRTTPANLAELKRLLATLDAMPRQLLITVRQSAMHHRDGAQTQTSAGAIDAARIESTRSLESDRNTQSLQLIEGNRAFIQTGPSVPLSQRQILPATVNGWLRRGNTYPAEYRDALTGFYVLPRLAGDRVTLEVSPLRDTLSGPDQNLPPGSANVERIATTVAGRLGEWIELGAMAQGVPSPQSAMLGSTRDNSPGNWRILIKVEEIR